MAKVAQWLCRRDVSVYGTWFYFFGSRLAVSFSAIGITVGYGRQDGFPLDCNHIIGGGYNINQKRFWGVWA